MAEEYCVTITSLTIIMITIILMVYVNYLIFSSMIVAEPFRRSRSIQGTGRSATLRMTRDLDGYAFGWAPTH